MKKVLILLFALPLLARGAITTVHVNKSIGHNSEDELTNETRNCLKDRKVKSDTTGRKPFRFSFLIGNVLATPNNYINGGTNYKPLIFPLSGGSQTYGNTKITNWAITEPDFHIQGLIRLGKSNFQTGFNIQKIKTNIFTSVAGPMKFESPMGVNLMAAYDLLLGGIRAVLFSTNIGLTTGPTTGHPQRELGLPSGPVSILPGGIGGQWHCIGWNYSGLLRFDASLKNGLTIYINSTINSFTSMPLNVDGIIVPSETQNSLSFQFGLGYKF